MRWLAAAAAASVLLTVGACSGGDEKATSPKATATASDSPTCALLTAGDREALAGAPVDDVSPIESSPLPPEAQCRWTAGQLLVQVASQPATEWAQGVPAIFDQLEDPGAKTSKDDLAEIAKSRSLLKDLDDITVAEACELFSSVAQIGGFPDDSDTTVSYIPITDSVLGVSAQTCRDGYFVSVISAGPAVKESDRLNQAAEKAVGAAHTRAVKAGS